MRLATLLAVFGVGFSGTVMAGQSAIDQQVDAFFAKGMDHCKNAMELSRTSRQVAAAEFDRYQSYIGKVEALKPELKNDRMVQRQIEQCEQVGHDIARMEALPMVDKSLAVCSDVKSLLRDDEVSRAKARFLEYSRQRDKALELTDTVLKVGSNASKIRRCDRLEEKIIAAEQRIHHSEIKADRLISTLRKSNDSCEVTRSLVSDKTPSEESLEAAEAMLSQARDYFRQSEQYPEAVRRAEDYPGYESSRKIRQYMLEYSRCDQDVAARLTEKREILAQQQSSDDMQVAEASTGQQQQQAEVTAAEDRPGTGAAPELVQMVYGIE